MIVNVFSAIEYSKIGCPLVNNFKTEAPMKAKIIAGIPNFRITPTLAFLPKTKNLNRLFKKWTIDVRVMAISIGKNNPKTGSNIVPNPKPENKVNAEPIRATIHIIK
jgi:hypothetical protein